MKPNVLTREIIGAAIEVHRELGPAKEEAAYESALAYELGLRGLVHQIQMPLPVIYKGVKLDCGYRLDVLVADVVVLEIKSVEAAHPVHRAQVLSYLKLGGWALALLLNFNNAVLKDGIERFVLGLKEDQAESAQLKRAITFSRSEQTLRASARNLDPESERLAREIIASANEVHRWLGPGLLASAYGACLCHELSLRGVPFQCKRPLPLAYKGTPLSQSDEVALLVGGRVVVSPHAISALQSVHHAALLSQLRLGGWKVGLLINFHSTTLADGIQRVVLT